MVRKSALLAGGAAALVALAGAAFLYAVGPGLSSDHADSPAVIARPGADLTDVYVFPAPDNDNNVVLAVDAHPLIPPGQGPATSFDPGVMYQLKVDNSGDHVEDLVIQFRARGSGMSQQITMYGPARPNMTGTQSTWIHPTGTFKYNRVTHLEHGITVFAGPREDPFFFDLAQFFKIIPDRNFGYHAPGKTVPAASASCFNPPGKAVDFLSQNGFNVLSLVVELPRSMLAPKDGSPGKINVWATASVRGGSGYGQVFDQIERLSRPAVKEAFEAFASHDTTNRSAPTSDPLLGNDIYNFTTTVAGRSPAIANVLKAVLIPDEMSADLSQTGVKAAYLGAETGGATGSKFGGRGLSDNVIDISLGAIFGNTIPALKLAPDDHKETACLTTDNVGPGGKHFIARMPYLGAPR